MRYPDGIVVCTPVPPSSLYVTDPVVIFEGLSESAARADLVAKSHEYEATLLVQRSIILDQETVAGTQFERIGGDWVGHILRSDAVLRMPEISVELPLAELYEGLFAAGDTPG